MEIYQGDSQDKRSSSVRRSRSCGKSRNGLSKGSKSRSKSGRIGHGGNRKNRKGRDCRIGKKRVIRKGKQGIKEDRRRGVNGNKRGFGKKGWGNSG